MADGRTQNIVLQVAFKGVTELAAGGVIDISTDPLGELMAATDEVYAALVERLVPESGGSGNSGGFKPSSTPKTASAPKASGSGATPKQINFIKKLVAERGVEAPDYDSLSKSEASDLIKSLTGQ